MWSEVELVEVCIGASKGSHSPDASTACEGLEQDDCAAFAKIGICTKTMHAKIVGRPAAITALRQLPKVAIYGGAALGAALCCGWLFIAGVAMKTICEGSAATHTISVLAGVTFHIIDIAFDAIVIAKFFTLGLFVFMGFSMGFIVLPVVMNLFVISLTHLTGETMSGEKREASCFRWLTEVVLSILQLKIFLDAYRSICSGSKTIEMTFTKMSESAFEAFPAALLQLYAAMCCLRAHGTERLILMSSVASGVMSLAYGFLELDFHEQQVSTSARAWNFAFRLSELTSRIFSISVFAYIMRPANVDIHTQAQTWIFIVLGIEYCLLLATMIAQAVMVNNTGMCQLVVGSTFFALALMVASPPLFANDGMGVLPCGTWRTAMCVLRALDVTLLCAIAVWTAWSTPSKWDFMASHMEYPIAVFVSTIAMCIFSMCYALPKDHYARLVQQE